MLEGARGRLIDCLAHTERQRPTRSRTDAIVVHRIFVDNRKGRGAAAVEHFFLNEPWGVATVTVSGRDLVRRTVREWQRSGVPEESKARSYVPYTAVVDQLGDVYQYLPWGVRGAHARGYNSTSPGIAFVGDFRSHPPTTQQIESGIALLRDLQVMYPYATIIRHSDTEQGSQKQCPGSLFPFDDVVDAARDLAGEIMKTAG